MPVAPRTIGFLSEVIHTPQTPDAAPIQRLHDAMFRSGDPAYRNFAVTHEGCLLSNPVARAGAKSQAAFLGDRMRFTEEHSGLTVDDFARRVRGITEQVCEARSLPIIVGQVVTIRTLVTPRSPSDGLEFMRASLLGLEEELEDFGRPAASLGIRLAFTPRAEDPNAFALRVESVLGDPRSLWIECQGTFPAIQVARGLDAVEENALTTYTFATGRALSFLERFDGTRT
ncbi:MAG: hypothetical protein ACYSWX_09850 [Planctomycetota bacterium]|jgi:hypothetical protein